MKSQNIFSIITLFLFCSFYLGLIPQADAVFADDNWQHIYLSSQTGVKINVDYVMSNSCISFSKDGRIDFRARMASPVWINVYGAPLNSSVELTMISFKQDMISHGGGTNPIVRTYDHYDRSIKLRLADNYKFTASLGSVATRVTSSSARIEEKIIQQIQVRVNGVPLVDPITGAKFFSMSMYDRVPCF